MVNPLRSVQEILDARVQGAPAEPPCRLLDGELARRLPPLRPALGEAMARLQAGAPLWRPLGPGPRGPDRGEGHFHLAPELFLQLQGWTDFAFPDAHQHLAAGEALLMPPCLRHEERVGADAPDRPFINLVVYAEDEVLSFHAAVEARPGRPGVPDMEVRVSERAGNIRRWLEEAARQPLDGGWADTQARALVVAALASVQQALEADTRTAPTPEPEPALVVQARRLIQNALGDAELSVARLARELGCAPDYLSHLFSVATGERLAAHVVRRRMERAAHLLTHTAMATKEVAWACGYAHAGYFTRSFRAHHGCTPTEFRRSLEPPRPT